MAEPILASDTEELAAHVKTCHRFMLALMSPPERRYIPARAGTVDADAEGRPGAPGVAPAE